MTLRAQISAAVEAGEPDQVFDLLHTELQAPLNLRIFSCSIFDIPNKSSRRIFTKRPDIYPVSGLKPIVPNRWTKTVLDEGETFVANSLEEIAEVFPDHELIGSAGCGSAINLPVTIDGRFVGTVNMLSPAGEYTKDKVDIADQHLWLAQIGFMLHELRSTTA